MRIERRVVTVDLGARFASGRDEVALGARVGQVVRTLRSIPGVAGVRVRIEGGIPVGLFPGYDLRRTVTAPIAAGRPAGVRELQLLLVDLGFLAAGGVTGESDDETAVAVLAFEKWAGSPATGCSTSASARRCGEPPGPSRSCAAPGGGSRSTSAARSRS